MSHIQEHLKTQYISISRLTSNQHTGGTQIEEQDLTGHSKWALAAASVQTLEPASCNETKFGYNGGSYVWAVYWSTWMPWSYSGVDYLWSEVLV